MGSRPRRNTGCARIGSTIERLEARELLTAPTLLAGATAANANLTLASLSAENAIASAEVARQPTPHELAREAFVAKFAGRFVTGPGRFTDQASQSFIKGAGTSSAFLHGNLQMVVYTPIDPTGQTTGLAALIVKNVSNTGNLLVLDLQGRSDSHDRSGHPTRFNWTVDGSSGGTFSSATGQGTVSIRYVPGGKLPRRA